MPMRQQMPHAVVRTVPDLDAGSPFDAALLGDIAGIVVFHVEPAYLAAVEPSCGRAWLSDMPHASGSQPYRAPRPAHAGGP
jgi:hypothetical protein